jgi:cob(I)alamin adenosyltransferase
MTGPDGPPVYTKTGDDGSTGLLFGGRVSKADAVMELCGTVDEAVAALGLARAELPDHDLAEAVLGLQRGLFVVGADLAANPSARERLVPGLSKVTPDLARTFLRRVERRLVAARRDGAALNPVLGPYLNRASDLAYVLARRAADEHEELLSHR